MNKKNILKLIAAAMILSTSGTFINQLRVQAMEKNNDKIIWNFDTSEDGWKYGGAYDYKGKEGVSYADDLKALKLDVDYSNDDSVSWSEFKISNTFENNINFNNYNKLTFDFIYNPDNMTKGEFKAKLFIDNCADVNTTIDLEKTESLENGLKKAVVTMEFDSKDVNVNSVIIGIIGSNTDYKGSIYIDNITFKKEAEKDVYVKKTAQLKEQEAIDISSLEIPSGIRLVDDKAISEASSLYSYLIGVGKTDKVIYGHQNDTHHKAVLKDSGTNSDTKDLTGSIAGICGIDTLSLTGDELSLTDEEKQKGIDLITKAADLSIKTADEGGIITLSSHMPNFELVAQKGKVNGRYDFSGYSPNVTSGNIVSRIMPGGDLNEVYTQYLDMIASYADKLQNAGVPVLFRPFHENNGSWFWWGKSFCDEEGYKNLFRYTVEYMRDTKNIHNFLYVYSPNGPFENEEDYLSRYPGDEFVDVLAFDMYHNDPQEDVDNDPWMNTLESTIELVENLADRRGKLSTVSETGIICNGKATPVSGNVNKNWFSEVSDIISQSSMPYFMVWANFETGNFFAPYMVDDSKGHEMINEFINYYNDDKSIFANQTGDYRKTESNVDECAYKYGFITYPSSRSRILNPVTVTAKAKGYSSGKMKFVIKNKEGKVIDTVKAVLKNGIYSGEITQYILDKAGKTVGTIELCNGDSKLNTIKALFNVEEPAKDSKKVDDFESYVGEKSLFDIAWGTNCGPGCTLNPELVEKENGSVNDQYELKFNYKISTEKTSEGWAGMTKNVDADWSDCDALQLWCRPDGEGQKLVIQITSNGEDFEVWLPEFAGTTEEKVLTLPFSEFKGKNGGTLDLTHIEKMGIWCNTNVPEGYSGAWTVESSFSFDNIKAVQTQK